MAHTNCLAAAAVRMTLRYPFWTEVFYSMSVVEDTTVTTAATDGRTFWVNPKWWATLSLDEAVAVMAHEIGHKIFLHSTRQGSRDPQIWNVACDYAINAILRQNGFTLPKPHLYDAAYEGMNAEAIYAELVKQINQNPKSGTGTAKDGQGRNIPGVSREWENVKDIRQQTGTPEQTEAYETSVKELVERALANSKARGSAPSGVEIGIVDVFKPAREPWYNHLHRFMQSLAVSEYNWARLNRRTLRTHGYFSPLHLSDALGDIAVFIDTSGSCYTAAEQSNFMSHLNAILADTRPQRVRLYAFDAAVYPAGVMDAGDMELPKRLRGGGGTCFEPIFRQLDDDGISPAVTIILTDMHGSFPNTAPDYPVLWCSTSDVCHAPFGEVVCVRPA